MPRSPSGKRTAEYIADAVGEQHFHSEYRRRYHGGGGSPDSGDEKTPGKSAGITTFKAQLVNNAPGAKVVPMPYHVQN